jgi:predicted dehydrogenase
MADKVHVGIIGTSWWAEAMFLPAFQSHPAAEVTAICGRSQDRANELAAAYGIQNVYGDYRALLDQPGLDAVVVATPDDLHYTMTMDALDAGLHVLCEKPMALNAGQAREMYEKAEATNMTNMVLLTWRWLPHNRYLKQLVDEGYVGRCYQAYFSFLAPFGRDAEYQWRFDSQRSNGVISDLGAHMIDFARWYAGDVRRVSAQLSSFVDRPGTDGRPAEPANDAAVVTLEHEGGTQTVIQVSAMTHTADRGVDIRVLLHGANGSLEAEHIFYGSEAGAKILGSRQDQEIFEQLAVPDELLDGLETGDPLEPFVKQAAGPRLFVDAILEERPVSPSFYDGYKAQEVIEAALESDRSGRSVSLDGAGQS